GFHPGLALDPESHQCADLAAQFDGLFGGQVAQMLHFNVTPGVLVDGEGVDHADGVAPAELLELGDDFAMKVRMIEAQHDELDRTDGHLLLLHLMETRGTRTRRPMTACARGCPFPIVAGWLATRFIRRG